MTLEERIEKVEKELKRTRKVNLVLLAGLMLAGIVFIVGSAKPANIIKADGFILLDDKGKERARLVMDTVSPGPKLDLLNQDGKIIISMFSTAKTTGLDFLDKRGMNRISMAVSDEIESGPVFNLLDKGNNDRLRLMLDNGFPVLEMLDPNGTVKWQAPPD
jgi:hypothetical protein